MNRLLSWRLEGQMAVDRSWLFSSVGEPLLVSIAGRTTEENEAIQKKLAAKRADVEGDKIALEVEVSPLPGAVPRAGQRRDEFRTAIEDNLKKSLADYSLNAPEGKSLQLKAGLRECRVVDLVGPNGRTPLFQSGPPHMYNVAPNGPDSLGVLARLEIRDRGAGENDDPLWLVEAWFAHERMIPGGGDLESSVQLLVPWERAIDWLDGQSLPDTLVDAKQFQPLGNSELSADALEARK